MPSCWLLRHPSSGQRGRGKPPRSLLGGLVIVAFVELNDDDWESMRITEDSERALLSEDAQSRMTTIVMLPTRLGRRRRLLLLWGPRPWRQHQR